MNINRISNIRPGTPDTPVTVKRCGNVIEVRYAVLGPPEITIEKLNADEYTDLRTGEVKEFQHHANRAADKASVAQSLRKLRDLINANMEDPETALWVTLTYRENMKDPARLYEDYRRFWQRFKYYLNKQSHPPAEYIIAAEPQGRGAWHLHCLFLYPGKAPYIPNADMAKVWGQGFTKTQSLKGVGNPGLYLTAYLGDMELTEAINSGTFRAGRLAESKDQRKAVIKGARLKLYPPGFNLYRYSRGVKRPEVWQTTEREAQAEISGMPLTYEKTIVPCLRLAYGFFSCLYGFCMGFASPLLQYQTAIPVRWIMRRSPLVSSSAAVINTGSIPKFPSTGTARVGWVSSLKTRPGWA